MPMAVAPEPRATHATPSLRWAGTAEPETVGHLRRLLSDRATALGADDALRGRIALAVSEAVSNVVVHAYRESAEPGPVEAALAFRDGTVTISVRDHGIGFLPRTDSPGLGLGLPLMASTADVMDITAPADGGVEVRLAFALRADAAVAAAA